MFTHQQQDFLSFFFFPFFSFFFLSFWVWFWFHFFLVNHIDKPKKFVLQKKKFKSILHNFEHPNFFLLKSFVMTCLYIPFIFFARFSHQVFLLRGGWLHIPKKKKGSEKGGGGEEKRRLLSFCTRVFLFVNYVISQTGEHPEEDLVKFGYKLIVNFY